MATEEIDPRERIPNVGIGSRVMRIRNQKKLKLTHVAQAVGVDPTTLGRLEREETDQISLLLVHKLATHLKVSWKLLMEGPEGEELAEIVPSVANRSRQPVLEAGVYRRAYGNQTAGAIDEFFHEFYPKDFKEELRNAEQLWATGTNLRRIVLDRYHLSSVRNILKRGGELKVLMNHPESASCAFAMIQDRGVGSSLEEYKADVHRNLSKFCELRETAPNGKNLQLRTIDYPLSFGLDVINGHSDTDGIIYVRFYPLPDLQQTSEDRPIIRLSAAEGYWYDFFKEQFERHWLEKGKKGLAEDVPPKYPWRSSWAELSGA